MLYILCETDIKYFVLDLLDIEFKKITSSLFYYCRMDGQNYFDMFYYRQLRVLFWLWLGKIFHV
jgi:hypothetical protein